MKRLKVGVHLGLLGLPLRRGLVEAERWGVTGVQVDAVGDLSPKTLSETGRREFRHLLSAHNLELTSLGCPLHRGLDVAEGQEARIEHVRSVLTLSFDLRARTVVVEAGAIPEDAADPRARLLTEALLALGHHGDRTGTMLALQTGLEPAPVLRAFLDRLDTGGLGVNFDPANLLMHGFDPYENARALHGRIVHAYARDARQAGAGRTGREVPLGHGELEWMQMIGVFEEIEYRGWLTVYQEAGDDRLPEVAAGVQFLRRFLGAA
jgi:sugar phosphate isomerase/epimerase